MNDLSDISSRLQAGFEQILEQHMLGMPILNNEIQIQVLGMQEWEGRSLGLVITPWLMSLVLLPKDGDDWAALELGDKTAYAFPNRDLDFQANEIDGIGYCQTYAIYSPMSRFGDHASAVEAAEKFLEELMVPAERHHDTIDEQRMQRYLNGEDMAQIRADEEAEKERLAAIEAETLEEKMDKPLSRRSLLRGSFLKHQG